jgi:putative colanic acid biosynthesis acetyltransferase WcaF
MDSERRPSALSGGPSFDISSNRRARKYTLLEQLRRVLWALVQPFFRWSPRPLFGWRRFLLRSLGATIGLDVHIYNSAIIYFPWNLRVGDHSAIGEHALVYNLGLVSLGDRVTISHRAHLCAGTHDYRNPTMPLLKPPITVRSDAWICTDAFIGPGVIVGEGAVVGARAVVVKDVPAWSVVAGNPARVVNQRSLEAQAGCL